MGREIVSIATALVPYPPERVWAVVTDSGLLAVAQRSEPSGPRR